MTRRYLTILAFVVTGLGGFAAGSGFRDWRLARCREQLWSISDLAELRAEENRDLERRLEEALK